MILPEASLAQSFCSPCGEILIDMLSGIIISRSRNFYFVASKERDVFLCRAPFTKNTDQQNPYLSWLAPGDRVIFTLPEKEETGVIIQVLPRHSLFGKRSASKQNSQNFNILPLAANIDQAAVLTSFTAPKAHFKLIDSLLCCLREQRLRPILIVTKKDETTKKALHLSGLLDYESLGIKVLFVSALTGAGLNALKKVFQEKTTLLIGASGVGKSTLVNTLTGAEQKISGLTSSHIGRNTTNLSRLLWFTRYEGSVIDTPGVRSWPALFSVQALARLFPLLRLEEQESCCASRKCLHLSEEGCYIKRQVAQGRIPSALYNRYVARSADAAESSAREQSSKANKS